MVAITIAVVSTTHAFQGPRVVHADRGVASAALVRTLDAEYALVSDALPCSRSITIITADTLDTAITIEAFGTNGRGATAADIALGVTDITGAVDTLTAVRWTLRIALTANTSSPAVNAEWGVPTTAGVAAHLANHTGVVHALLTTAVGIIQASHTGTAIGQTLRCIPTAAGIIRWVASDADFCHALLAITVSIAATAHTSTAIGHADRRLAPTACVIYWVTELACIVHTLCTIGAVIIAGAFDALHTAISLHANRSV